MEPDSDQTIEMLKKDCDAEEKGDSLWAAKLEGDKEALATKSIMYLMEKTWDPGPMLERVTQPAAYKDAVLDISQDPHIKKSYNARIVDVTKALAGKGLVKEDGPTLCPLSAVAHRIKTDLLDPTTRIDPLPLIILLGPDRMRMTVRPRTSLSWALLSKHPSCTIAIFSSTAEPRIYQPETSRGVICFLHEKNPLARRSTFAVLQVTDRTLVSSYHPKVPAAATAKPAIPTAFLSLMPTPVQAQTDPLISAETPPAALSSGPFYSSTVSPQFASPSSLSMVEWPPLPSAQSESLSSSSATSWPPVLPTVSPMQPAPPPLVSLPFTWDPFLEPSHSLISTAPFASSPASPSPPTKPPHAMYHLKKRKENHTSKDTRKHLTIDVAESFYTIACEEPAHQEINNKVAGFWRNKRKKDSPDDVFTAAKKKKTLDGMVAGRVPPGLNDEAVKKVKEGCDSTETFKKENLNLILDTGTRQSLYRDSVRKVFEATWDVAILPYQPQPTIDGAPDDGGSGSSTSTMGAGPARRTGDAAEGFQRMDEDEIFSMVEAESKAREQKRLRTVTVSLKDIVRQELLDMKIVRESKDESSEGPEQVTTAFAEMIRILREKQEVLANATDELACLGRKTTILMSQNRFSTPGQSETGLEPEPLQRREVPFFDFRGSLVPLSFTPRNDISSTIPVARLPDTLEGLVNSTPKGKDDRWTRDVQDLLSYHHLSYIYSRCLSPRGVHKKSDEDHPLWSELADELDAQSGLDCLQQGWIDGDPHPMAGLFNLAPIQEMRYFERVRRLANKKVREREDTKASRSLTHKSWVDRTEALQSHLGGVVASGGSQDRICELLAHLTEQAVCEPDSAQRNDGDLLSGGSSTSGMDLGSRKHDKMMNTVTLIEATGEAMDEVDEEAEEEEERISHAEGNENPNAPKEPSRARLKAIQAVTKMLLESPKLDQPVDINWVRKSTNRPDDFTQSECEAIVRIVEALTDYVPKQYNAATMIRVVLISNSLLRYPGYANFARKYAPAPSISSLHPIPLGAAALYEILCSNGPYHFDARIDDTHLISSVEHANKNQSTVISYINPYTVRILGEVLPAYQDRGGRPIVSDLDEAKKDKTRKRTDQDWGREGSRTGISQESARKRLVDIEKDLKELECLQEEKRQKWLKADQDRYELSAYQDLFQARRTAERLFLDWLKNDSRLRDLRATRYALQNIAKTRSNTSLPNSTPPPTQSTWSNPCRTESMRIDHLLDGLCPTDSSTTSPRGIGATSDDPGLCKLNTYAVTTLSKVTESIRHYTVATSNRFSLLSVVDGVVGQKPHEEQERDLAALLPTYTVTAPLINDLTFSNKYQKKREKKLATDTPNAIATRAAHAELSSNSINTTLTLDAIDSAQEVRRGARQACREFEGGKWRLRDLRDQEIRTKRVYTTLAAEQRSNAKEAVIKDLKSKVEDNNTTIDPKAPTSIPLARDVAVVVLHGEAGTSVGSRIKGHQKRGGSKLTKEHRKYGTIAHTNENRTSRICSCCFMPVFLSRGRRIRDGELKTVRLNGSVDCKNPTCPRRRAGHGAMGRDANAANNIAIPGASFLLSTDYSALPPYCPFSLPTNNTSTMLDDFRPKSTH
ncbi:hypothetical protein EC957_006764 [Mortierella hygrophila]|uniref:Uncharacterized protein n=1 Tax=Mortierella hygrophila TaxID=979708 RepID=A0A9P6JYT5_9FUNG|nr:hypothetical protein EC957_006764 [Mortierella hygrophila]